MLIHRDYKQQEPRIAAFLSGDAALLEACLSGDVYIGLAKQLGLAHHRVDHVHFCSKISIQNNNQSYTHSMWAFHISTFAEFQTTFEYFSNKR